MAGTEENTSCQMRKIHQEPGFTSCMYPGESFSSDNNNIVNGFSFCLFV